MRIRLAVWVGPASASARRVTLTAPDSCAPEDLRAERVAVLLATTLGVSGDALALRDHLVHDGVRLGHPPLLDGASIHLVERDRWCPPRRPSPAAALEVAVIGGPDAGLSRPLTAGSHTIGRAGADLTVGDPSLSRLHVRLDVTPTGLRVTDLDSENGTIVGARHLSASGTDASPGEVLRLGNTTLTVRPARIAPAATVPRGDGTLTVSRASAPLGAAPRVQIAVPAPPQRPPPRRVPWVAALLPVPVALLLSWFFGPHLLLFALMSPLMILGTVVSDRFGARRTYAEEAEQHRATSLGCAAQRESALAAERNRRETTFPDLAGIARIAMTPGRGLWSRPARRDAPLVVRLGRGTVDSGVTWTEDGATQPVPLPDAPVLVDLTSEGSVSITGPLAGAVTDSVLGQLLTLHSPADLTVLTDRPCWARVQHVRTGPPHALLQAARARLGHADQAPGLTVVAVDGTSLSGADVDTLSLICREGAGSGVVALVTGGRVTAARVQVHTHGTAPATAHRTDAAPDELHVDGVGPAWVRRVVAALTPLRDGAERESELPHTVALGEVLPGEVREAADVATRWALPDDGAWVTLGASLTGPLRLDLAAAGPHALIGGTTGSGKSELLRTLVTSLALEHPPQDVAVVLVDYKGGSAFAGLEEVPHIVGVVTDLDHALTRRALVSLRAEISRRERLLAQAGAADIGAYRRRSRPPRSGLPHLARLVIVIDEFRALADELPDFVAGLVRLAAVGRSLGLHLVLATQRPGGVVTADMRANLNLRIALRVRDRVDSQDVIESDAAAALPRSAPGRAVLRAGAEPLQAFQTATVGDAARQGTITAQVTWSDGTVTSRAIPTSPVSPPVDLVELVAEAARSGHHSAPRSPWLPALPTTVTWSAVSAPSAWALVDDPAHQSQEPTAVSTASMPHTAIAGALGSGRTTTALTLTLAALDDHPDLHLYAVADPTGALASLRHLPHTGAVVDRADPAAIAAFVDHLGAEVRRRQGEAGEAYLLVVVDGWDVVADACDRLDHGALTDRLLATLREGYALGIRAVVTGDRSVLTGRVGRTFPERYVHRPGDDTDLVLAGLRPGEVPADWPPGRLVRVRDGLELQVLVRGVLEGTVRPPTRGPWRLTPLPARLRAADLPGDPPGELTLGMGGDGRPVTVGQPGRRRVLVLGSPGSGRTTTLATLGARAAAAGRVVCVVSDPHAPPPLGAAPHAAPHAPPLLGAAAHATTTTQLRSCGGVHVVDWGDPDELIELRRAHPGLVVVADDVERHLDSPLVPVLEQLSELAERDGGLIAVTGDSAGLSGRVRGLGVAVARGRTAVVLGVPTVLDGDLVGVRLPRVGEVIPGRGWVVADRRVSPLQVAVADADYSSAAVRPFHPT